MRDTSASNIALWSIAVVGTIALAPLQAIAAQQSNQQHDDLTPRVIVVAAFSDSAPGLTDSVVRVAQERIPQKVSPHRLWLISKRDIDNTLVHEWDLKLVDDYRELSKLLRAVGAVVLTAHGRPDSLDVIGSVVFSRRQPVDTMRFQAPSVSAAVDSIMARLLADARFRRGAK